MCEDFKIHEILFFFLNYGHTIDYLISDKKN